MKTVCEVCGKTIPNDEEDYICDKCGKLICEDCICLSGGSFNTYCEECGENHEEEQI